MSLIDRCSFDKTQRCLFIQSETEKSGFQYRLINIASVSGTEPEYEEGKYNEAIKIQSNNQILEIVEDGVIEYFSSALSSSEKKLIKLRCVKGKDNYILSFPSYYSGVDLSRVYLLSRDGVPFYFGTGNPETREWHVKTWDGICKIDRFCDSFISIIVLED